MAKFDGVVDSGERQTFDSGSKRDTAAGKGRPDLLPVHALIRIAKVCDPDIIPIHGIIRLSVHYENGAEKYGDRNWELGQPFSRYFSSMFRHLQKWVGGAREEDHLAAVSWNACAIMDHEERIERNLLDFKWDDMPRNRETGLPVSAFKSSDIIVAPWSRDGHNISHHAWVAFDHMLWWVGGDRTVDHLAIIARAAMTMIEIEERVERGLMEESFMDVTDLGIFRDGEFLEADRKRKEEKEAAERKLVLLAEADPEAVPGFDGGICPSDMKRRGPGPDPDSMKRYSLGDEDAYTGKAVGLGAQVTETEA